MHIGIIPAYAGSTDAWSSRKMTQADHPRIRGEHRCAGEPGALDRGSSPHTRGARQRSAYAGDDHGIIPAYAGSTGRRPRRCRGRRDHPRIRGEHGHFKAIVNPVQGSSPHTRGAPVPLGIPAAPVGIIPAYAGSTCAAPWASQRRTDHPRIRGEHPPRRGAGPAQEGSSPHTRGAQSRPFSGVQVRRIIPAYAGSTLQVLAAVAAGADHPRIRGEHWSSSPSIRISGWIIPAYAGSTYLRRHKGEKAADHPRIRGEHGIDKDAATQSMRIIPAYAGSTSRTRSMVRCRTDHPRIRGEHTPSRRKRGRRAGSSPHTRGAQTVS